MKAQVFGQDEAIDRVVSSIKFSRSGLARENKPVGCFLFTGPTGVGKTEVAKQLAFQTNVPLVRFDMSEYMEKHTVARLIGAPPGYVGFEEGGQLTEAINKTPHCVLLLDEMEKAHPDIFNVLLQVMDGGRLTDSNGRTVDFKNVTFVMTSNAGAVDVARGSMGIVSATTDQISKEVLKRSFAPEFLNRLDAVVNFKPLDDQLLLRVVGKFVEELRVQLQAKKVELHVAREVHQFLLDKNRNPAFGARPFARAVEEHLKRPLVDDLLFGKLTQGGRVHADLRGPAGHEQIHFEVTPLS
jgi:ATP-dependent Clp protease ATP-binding subunit ClpA